MANQKEMWCDMKKILEIFIENYNMTEMKTAREVCLKTISSVNSSQNMTTKQPVYENVIYTYQYLNMFVSPFFLLLGFACNITSFAVFRRKEYAKNITIVFFSFLSLTDIVVLIVGLLPEWIEACTGFYLLSSSTFACKFLNVVSFTASSASVWTVVIISIERFIAVNYPHKKNILFTKQRSYIAVVTLLLVITILNSHFFITLEVTVDNGTKNCAYGQRYRFVQIVWPWVDASVFCFLPTVLIWFCNSCIIYGRRMTSMNGMESPNISNGGTQNNSAHRRRGRRDDRLFCQLICISVLFSVTTIPISVFTMMTVEPNSLSHLEKVMDITELLLARTAFKLLMYLNHVLNFPMYYLSSPKFRKVVKSILKIKFNA